MGLIQKVEDWENATTTTIVKVQSDIASTATNAIDFTKIAWSDILKIAKKAYTAVKDTSVTAYNTVKNYVTDYIDTSAETANNTYGTISNVISSLPQDAASFVNQLKEKLVDILNSFSDVIGSSTDELNTMNSVIQGILTILSNNLSDYVDGIAETTFGSRAEASWYGSSTSAFLNGFQSMNKNAIDESRMRVNILKSTPLDPSEQSGSLYGSMMLGAPFSFNELSDPTNRTLINTLVKDGKFITFTPGLPKYNGTSYGGSKILEQTKTPTAMLEYLTRNGLDQAFSDTDKRYYTFKTDYENYFSYLETMLNVAWIKMGLAKNGNTFNIFSFFDIKGDNINGGINPEARTQLLSQYQSSIGFFTNPSGRVTESISNSTSADGDELASRANENARQYQRINYITGMGTGSSVSNLNRTFAIASQTVSLTKNLMGEMFSGAKLTYDNYRYNGSSAIKSLIAAAALAVVDVNKFTTTEDLGAIMLSFATSNGMQVKYPNLWTDSAYSRSMSFDFNFASPYGDPLSIFKYVYVPFFALMCFAMPRQAAENGYVSPFFVRCDIPGLFTSDLALISDITWTKGGNNNLWTKDGLPREISCSITIQDLYPYLAMSKRISFLSANPSYAVFLDSMSGMLSLNDNSSDDALNSYFKELINRVNGIESNGNKMWNKFNSSYSTSVKSMSESVHSSLSATVDPHAIPWLHNSSIK